MMVNYSNLSTYSKKDFTLEVKSFDRFQTYPKIENFLFAFSPILKHCEFSTLH